MSAQPVIRVAGLTKVFRDFWRRARVRAVNDLNFEIEPGEVFGLLGPNGSGKSTTIKMILGLLYPTRGRISVFSRPPDDVRIKARIGYLPEESYLYRFLNARETLDYYGTLFRLDRRNRRRRIEELLEMVGLRSAARRPVGEYSKGMARRIGLAQALINDPDLLILDEPTSGLDPIGTKLVKDIIVRLGEVHKKTVLLSSHLLADVEEVCQRVTILYGGRVRESGRLETILSRQDMMQMTCETLSPKTLTEVQAVIQRLEGKTLVVNPLRDRLEALFLRIVERAQSERLETAGSAPAGEIAGFLGEEQRGQALLDHLVQVEPEAPAPEAVAAPPPAPTAVDSDMLSGLTGTTPPPPAPPKPAPAPRAGTPEPPAPSKPSGDVDRSLLDELTGGAEQKDDA